MTGPGAATVGSAPLDLRTVDYREGRWYFSGYDYGHPDSGVTLGEGSFAGLPDCAPEPVVGNHGQYVSGAAKAGVKGAALATIARNGALVGPYPG